MRNTDVKAPAVDRKTTRIFNEAGAWFYHTREGRRGPFDNQNALRADLATYAGTMAFISDPANEMPGDVDCADVTCVEISAPMF